MYDVLLIPSFIKLLMANEGAWSLAPCWSSKIIIVDLNVYSKLYKFLHKLNHNTCLCKT